MTGLTNNFNSSGKQSDYKVLLTAHNKLASGGEQASNSSETYGGHALKPHYNAVSKDGDTVQLSELATSSANKLKQLYSSHKITKQQYDKFIKRFEQPKGEESQEENFDVKVAESTAENTAQETTS